MFVVIREFVDLKDDNYLYRIGDIYPRKGKKATKARCKELSSHENKVGKPLIEAKEE